MSYSNILDLTYEDVVKAIKGSVVGDFASTDGGSDGSTLIEGCLDEAIGYVRSRLPGKYRKMMTKVDGEVLAKDAAGTETAFTLGISSATASSVKLYKNYFEPWKKNDDAEVINNDINYDRNTPKRWDDRNNDDEMDSSDYTVSGQAITLDAALGDHDTLYAEYEHSLATPPKILVRIAKDIAVYFAARDHLYLHAEEFPEAIKNKHEEAVKMLDLMQEGKLGISEFDEIDLVDDWDMETGQVFSGLIERG